MVVDRPGWMFLVAAMGRRLVPVTERTEFLAVTVRAQIEADPQRVPAPALARARLDSRCLHRSQAARSYECAASQ